MCIYYFSLKKIFDKSERIKYIFQCFPNYTINSLTDSIPKPQFLRMEEIKIEWFIPYVWFQISEASYHHSLRIQHSEQNNPEVFI